MVGAVIVLPLLLDNFWMGLVAEGIAFAVIFLSYTLVTGEGGMIWLCQVTFAGVGALTTAQLATVHGWPLLAAVVAGGLVAALMGIVIGFLTIRLGDLYVALVTLTFGLLMETLVFSRDLFIKFGVGVSVPRPEFAEGDQAFAYLMIAVFLVIAVFIVNLRRSTTGMALNAVRWSEPAARTVGLSPLKMKVLVSGLAAFVAGVGGGFLASYLKVALPVNYATLAGMVWLAILVGLGARSTVAALVAGLTFTVFPEIISRNFPTSFAQVPPLLFGLTAIVVARHPDGALSMQGDQFRALLARLSPRRAPPVLAADDVRVARDAPRIVSPPVAAVPAGVPVLAATDVTVRFGGLVALSDVSLEVEAGTIGGLVGPNGAGKSTLFGVVSGILRAETGRVSLAGVDVTARHRRPAHCRGSRARSSSPSSSWASPCASISCSRGARTTLAVASGPTSSTGARGGRPIPTRTSTSTRSLDLLGLSALAGAPVAGLPLGISRRIEVGRALATSPSVVLLDEPSSGLDGRETRQLANALTRVVDDSGVALLLVEHDVEMVLGLSQVVSVLEFGVLIAHGPPEAIRESPKVRAAYLGTEVPSTARAPEPASAPGH